jgi:hypothetical protein
MMGRLSSCMTSILLFSFLVIFASAEEDASSQCIANTELLLGDQDLLDAEGTWFTHYQYSCHTWGSSATNGSQCVLVDLSKLSSSQISQGGIVFNKGKFDFTKAFGSNQFNYYEKGCTEAGGKMCYSNLDAAYKGIIYNSTTFTFPISYVGFPLCLSDDCDQDSAKRLVKLDAVKYGSFFAGDLLENLTNASLSINYFECGNYTSTSDAIGFLKTEATVIMSLVMMITAFFMV